MGGGEVQYTVQLAGATLKVEITTEKSPQFQPDMHVTCIERVARYECTELLYGYIKFGMSKSE